MKKILMWTLFLGICFLSGALLSYHSPKVEAWLILLIEKETSRTGVVGVLPTRLRVGVFPPRVKLEGVRVLPRGDLAQQLEPFTIDEIGIQPSISALLRGSARAAHLYVTGAQLLVHPSGDLGGGQGEAATPFDLSESFKELPLDSLNLRDLHVTVVDQKGNLMVEGRGINLETFVSWGQMHLLADIEQVRAPIPGTEGTMAGKLSLSAEIFEDHLRVENLSVEQDGFKLATRGPLYWKSPSRKSPSMDLEFALELNGQKFSDFVVSHISGDKLPSLRGDIQLNGSVKGSSLEALNGKFALKTQGVSVAHYQIGTVTTEGTWTSEGVKSKSIVMAHPSGAVTIRDFEWTWGETETLAGEVQIQDVSLPRLLTGLGVRDVPVNLNILGTLPCEGQILTDFSLECQGKLSLFDLRVDGESKPIVEAHTMTAEGRVRIDGKQVQYTAAVSVGEKSKGKSSGTVNFDKGFDLNFETPGLYFSDLISLSGLKLEGSASLNGRTWGDSSWGRVEIATGGQDIWFEDYALGSADFKLTYRENNLSFNGIQGRLRKSRYAGNVNLDLARSTIKGDIDFTYFELQDIQHAFHKNLELPLELQGTGSGEIDFHGPFTIEELSYRLTASAYRGRIGPEYFDQLTLDVRSDKGQTEFHNSSLTKGSSTINILGRFQPLRWADMIIRGSQIQLQDSTVLNKWSNEIMGLARVDLMVDGTWGKVKTTVDAGFSNVRVSGRPMGSSTVFATMDGNLAQVSARLMDEAMNLNLQYPFNPGIPFELEMSAKEWDFTSFLTSVRKELSGRDYESSTTFSVNLVSPTGDPWKAEGRIQVPLLRVKRGTSELLNPRPVSLLISNGKIQIENFELSGSDGSIVIKDRPKKEDPLDVEIQSKLQLHFLSLLMPFLEDLQGTLSTSVNMRMGPDKFQLLGSAYIERGYFKSSEFPHPVEEVQADFLFNQRRILLNSAKGILAQGRVFANGEVEIRGLFDFPAAIDIRVENVQLEIPTNYHTRGSGQLKITGNWFPFTLGGEYRIQSGRITDNFDSSSGTTARRSKFLPPSLLLEQQSAPFQLDLLVKTESPMEITNDLVNGKVRAELRIRGTADRPTLLGNATIIPPSTLLFRDHEFQVENAQIRFDGGQEMNPSLYITARTRLNEYDIQMLVQGTSSRPEITLTSQPSLPEQDIITLLALGVPSQSGEGIETDMARQSTFQISALLFSDFGRQFKNQYNFDLQIAPIFDEENNATAHKVTLGRQLTPKIGAVASYEQGKSPKTDVKLKYQMNNQVFLVGSFENRPFTESVDVPETQDSNIFGLDLEYRVDFK